MVGTDAGGDDRGEIFSGDARAVAFDGPVRTVFPDGAVDLIDASVRFADDVVHVHDFAQADRAGPFHHFHDLGEADLTACRFQIGPRGGDGTRHGEADIQGARSGGAERFPDAVETEDIGDLMGLGDDGGHSVGQDGCGEGAGRHHGALDVHVAVDEAGNDELPGDVDGLFRLKKFRALRPGVDDLSMMDGQIGGDESFQVGVEYLPAGKKQIDGHGEAPFFGIIS